jgi:serralysin
LATPTSNSVPTTANLPISGDIEIAGLQYTTKWGGPVGTGVLLTYSFPGTDGNLAVFGRLVNGKYSSDDEPGGSWSALTVVQQGAFEDALHTISSVAGITFHRLSDNRINVGEIRVALSSVVSDQNSGAWAYYPGNHYTAGDIWLSPTSFHDHPITPGTWQFAALIHELGHALGLKHPHEFAGGNAALLPDHLDNKFYTVMSYNFDPTGNDFFPGRYPTTPMLLDVKALQYLYGPNTSHNSGNDVYVYIESGQYLETIWDAGGIDTIDYRNSVSGARIDLREGAWSSLGEPVIFWQFQNVAGHIDERTVWIAYGAKIENAVGGAGEDTIYGNNLANSLVGNAGNDMLYGFGGQDTLRGGAGDDLLDGGPGHDLVYGGSGDDVIYGDIGGDTLYGDGGHDRLYGGQGDDELRGGAGSDTLYGDGGRDWLVGGAGNDLLYGGAGNDKLEGQGGDDVLYGGAGTDVLRGGAGSDTLYGDDGNDRLFGQGGDDLLYGGAGDDILNGGPGSDTLDGGGGADLLRGGPENDLYVVRSAGDVVAEKLNDGHDSVHTFVDFQLPSHVEDLVLLGNAWHGIGNNLNNMITGNDGDNRLEGRGGDDLLFGGFGNDTLVGGPGDDGLDGGAGNDYLRGGPGDDRFIFNAPLGPENVDRIADFEDGADRLVLVSDWFPEAGSEVTAENFIANDGGTATSTAHRIIYNTGSGALYYDADGSGAGAPVLFAVLENDYLLTHDDFEVLS